MKISELSEASGVSVATIKFYIREGLIPAGELTAPNRAHYSERHLERLRLVRALRDLAGLPLSEIRDVFEAMEGGSPDYLGRAFGSLRPAGDPLATDRLAGEAIERAHARLLAAIHRRGWQREAPVLTSCDAWIHVVRALAIAEQVCLELGSPATAEDEILDVYLDAAARIAAHEIGPDWNLAPTDDERPAQLAEAVLGTVLNEPVIIGLRRLAHTQAIARLAIDRQAADPAP